MKKNMPIYCLLVSILLLLLPHSPVAAQRAKPVLNHIAVYVRDLKTSTSFYRDVVMIDTIPEPFHDGKHTWFDVGGGSHLHLIQGAAEAGAHDKNNHLCFSVVSVEDVIDRLAKNGTAYYDWSGKEKSVTTRVDGIRQIYFKDPDGYWIEINSDYPKTK